MTGQPFESNQHVLLFHERHFAVYLGEFRLPVGAEVFVPEAFDNLEIFIKTGNHQQLLEDLGRLGQGIEFPGIHAGRDHEVAGSFRGRFDHHRGFNLDESFF